MAIDANELITAEGVASAIASRLNGILDNGPIKLLSKRFLVKTKRSISGSERCHQLNKTCDKADDSMKRYLERDSIATADGSEVIHEFYWDADVYFGKLSGTYDGHEYGEGRDTKYGLVMDFNPGYENANIFVDAELSARYDNAGKGKIEVFAKERYDENDEFTEVEQYYIDPHDPSTSGSGIIVNRHGI